MATTREQLNEQNPWGPLNAEGVRPGGAADQALAGPALPPAVLSQSSAGAPAAPGVGSRQHEEGPRERPRPARPELNPHPSRGQRVKCPWRPPRCFLSDGPFPLLSLPSQLELQLRYTLALKGSDFIVHENFYSLNLYLFC